MNNQDHSSLHIGLVGSADFQRRLHTPIMSSRTKLKCFSCAPSEAWSKILTDRPNLVVIEVGLKHSDRDQLWAKRLITQVRERFGVEVYIVIALTSSEKLLYGGDLLFQDETSLEPSGFVDTFIAAAPGGVVGIPTLVDQIFDVITHVANEFERRARKKTPIPALGAQDWVHSLADPKSRELWMLWLPRYATYTIENPIITGLTGTGKTRLARALHLLSERSGPFVSITPRDFSSSELVQAELFGAVAGAYTGAVDKWGLVKAADKGTLFIDELQSIDKDLQGKLITFIENKSYRRVGSAETTRADVRFCFATNRAINDLVAHDVLRDDFAYRLERVQLDLEPLCNRRLDITAALAHALAKIRRERPQTREIVGVSSSAYRMLFSHTWPGNLRQLENTVAKLCEIADISNRNYIDDPDVTRIFDSRLAGAPVTSFEVLANAALELARSSMNSKLETLQQGVEVLVDHARVSALQSAGGDAGRASKLLGESSTLMELFSKSRQSAAELRALTGNGSDQRTKEI